MSIFAFICLYQLLTLKKKVKFRQLLSRPGACDPYVFFPSGDQVALFPVVGTWDNFGNGTNFLGTFLGPKKVPKKLVLYLRTF